MARRILPAMALSLLAAVFLSNAFVAAPNSNGLRGAVAAAGVVAVPQMAQAIEAMDAQQLEVGSSVSVAATVEALMLGIVLGTVPITVLGLFVSAWLQFKKGPTLGIWAAARSNGWGLCDFPERGAQRVQAEKAQRQQCWGEQAFDSAGMSVKVFWMQKSIIPQYFLFHPI